MPTHVNDERVGEAFSHFFQIVNKIENSSENARIILNFKNTQWVTPVFLLPLMLYINKCGRNVVCENITDYMKTVYFGNGYRADNIAATEQKLSSYTGKRYLPIINFTALPKEDNIRSAIASSIQNLLIRELKISGNIGVAIRYIIDEAIANIKDHSGEERGYIFAQHYPNKQYLDLCIADSGVGIYKSYQKAGITVENDMGALLCAIEKRLSSKQLPKAENRGYGIYTSRRMLVDGLGGRYYLCSGNAFHYYVKGLGGTGRFLELPLSIAWHGTIVALRIPYADNKSFNIAEYYE